MAFTEDEVAYLTAQPLGRIATVGANHQPDVAPVGFEFDGTYLWVGGRAPERTRKFLNVQAGHAKVALVVDDLVSTDPWTPRFLRVYSFLSGGLAGYVYASFAAERADIEPAAKDKMWDAALWEGANYMKTLHAFVFSQGKRYQDLIPSDDFLVPNRTHDMVTFEGWAYAAATKEKDFMLLYWEKGRPTNQLQGVLGHATYEAKWFDPRKSEWIDGGTLTSNTNAMIRMPQKPTEDDWGMRSEERR